MKSQQFSHVFNALHGRENRAGGRCESVHNVHLFTLYKNMHLFPKSEWKFAKLSRPKVGRKSRAKKNQTTGTHQQVATKRGESDSASGGRSPALNLLNPNPQTRPAPYNPPPLAGSLVMPGGDLSLYKWQSWIGALYRKRTFNNFHVSCDSSNNFHI